MKWGSPLKRKVEKWDWSIECENPTDYVLTFVFSTTGKVMSGLLSQAKAEMLRKKGVEVGGSLEVVDAFDVEPKFFNTLKVFIRKPFGITRRDIGKDGIVLLDYWVVGGRFVRSDGDVWKINIKVKGTYTDNRRG